MANDQAPERVWIDPATDVPFYEHEGPVEKTNWPMYVRADLCASPLPPPGSEGEAEMVERAREAFDAERDQARKLIGRGWNPKVDLVLVESAAMLAALRAAFGGSGGAGEESGDA